MSDNTLLNVGSGGDTIRDVSKSGIKTPVCIIDVGGGGAESLLTAGQAVKAASLPVTLASDQGALATTLAALPALIAGSALIGQVATSGQLNTLYNGTTPVTVQRAAITQSASGASVLVAGVGGQRVYVLKWLVIVGGATNLTFEDGSTPLTGALPLVANQPLAGAEGPLAHFVTTAGNALNLVSSAAVQVSGYLLFAQF